MFSQIKPKRTVRLNEIGAKLFPPACWICGAVAGAGTGTGSGAGSGTGTGAGTGAGTGTGTGPGTGSFWVDYEGDFALDYPVTKGRFALGWRSRDEFLEHLCKFPGNEH